MPSNWDDLETETDAEKLWHKIWDTDPARMKIVEDVAHALYLSQARLAIAAGNIAAEDVPEFALSDQRENICIGVLAVLIAFAEHPDVEG